MSSIQDFIGRTVRYFDYIGSERYGRIVYMEPCTAAHVLEGTMYVYIEDEEIELNIHEASFVDVGDICYAEIRISTDIAIVQENRNAR